MEKSFGNVACVVTIVLASAALAQAQSVDDSNALGTDCRYEFGSGDFAWCVSEAGNVVRLSVDGAEHIAVGTVTEGYVVCAAGAGPYYDVNSASAGWGEPVLVEGPTENAVIIDRTTLDGRFTLRQFIHATGEAAGDNAVTIRMTLTNNGERRINDVMLLRTADLDVDGTEAGDVFDVSDNAAFARQESAVALLALREGVEHEARVSMDVTPTTCTPDAFSPLPAADADLAVSVRYDLGRMAEGKSKSVRVRYQIF